MSGKYILAHDVGTGADKAVLTDERGVVMHSATLEYPVHYPKPGWAEQDAEELWKAVAGTTRQVFEDSGIDPRDIAGVALSAQMFNCLPVDEAGAPLMPMISWLDGRTVRQADAILEDLGAAFFFEHTANVPSAKDVLPKMLWIREERPEIWARTHKLLDCKEYLVHKLTGQFAIDQHGASVYFALDPESKTWAQPILEALEIPETMLPAIYPPTEVIGAVTEEAAAQTGLRAGTPVVLCAGDVATAQVGSGAVAPGAADLSLGTATWIGVTSDRVVNHADRPLWFLSHVDPAYWILGGEMETGGGAMRWFRDTFFDPEASYDEINKLAASVPPGSDHLLFLPWLSGERSPVPDHYARGGFVGLGLGHTKAHMARALMEGVALHLRWIVQTIEDLGVGVETINAIGGGVESDLWTQIIADVIGVELRVVQGGQEAGARGAALIAAVGLGLLDSIAGVEDVIEFERIVTPTEDSRQATYARLYENFTGLFEALGPFNRALYPGEGH